MWMIPTVTSGIRLVLTAIPWCVWRFRCVTNGHDWAPWSEVLWDEFRTCRQCDAFEHRMRMDNA